MEEENVVKQEVSEHDELMRLRKDLDYLIGYLRESEAKFYCEYRHDGPADMAFQRIGNIRADAESILNPEQHARWYENVRRLSDDFAQHREERLADIERRLKEEDEYCRKHRFN